jgi:hypothetical protein
MQKLSEFFRIYCHDNHKNWAELLPHIEEWLNKTFKIGYSATELMFREKKCMAPFTKCCQNTNTIL